MRRTISKWGSLTCPHAFHCWRNGVGSIYKIFYQKGAGSLLATCSFLVEMMGIEPMSENPLIRLSSQAVCSLAFPLESESRHSHSRSSPFVPGRLKSERPTQVHHSFDAQSEVVVLFGGTGGPQATALSSQSLTGKDSGSHSNSIVVV